MQAVHLLHITILLGIKYLFRCIDEQPHSFVTDANCLAITTCLFDHERSGGRLVQHCLKRLHRLWPKLVARCTTDLRQLLASCAAMPFTPIVVDAFRISSDPSLGGFCNARCATICIPGFLLVVSFCDVRFVRLVGLPRCHSR